MDIPDPAEGVDNFDLDRSTDEAWTDFAGRLAEVISHMDADAQLRIDSLAGERAGRAPFVSFACSEGGRLVVEAGDNKSLGERFRLSAEQLDSLAALGWQRPPAGDPGGFCRPGHQDQADDLALAATQVLREVFGVPHPAFLAPDQLAEILTPPGAPEPSGQPGAATRLAHREPTKADLDELIAAELAARLGHPPLQDADGDFALRVGSTMVFVRATGDAQEVLVFAPLVHDVEGRSRAMEVLSDLNSAARYVRFLLIADRVYLSLSTFAQPFVPAHLHQALRTVSLVADEIDEHLAAKLRGRTTFAAEF